MVTGINSFRERFKDMEDQYTIIGGTACDLLMSEIGENFRATKDLDIVLIIESITAEFGRIFWEYIVDAGYEHKNKSTGEPQFYRFSHPVSSEYPFMIEIFSRKPDNLILPEDAVLTPLPLDEELSSLSAILLDDNYYDFIKSGIIQLDGIAILDALHLIPLKAKAWADLSEKKVSDSNSVDSKDIKKHKNDIYRLTSLLTPEMQITVSPEIYDDIQVFINAVGDDNVNFKQLGIRGITQSSSVVDRLRAAYIK
ncbi:MAG: hypothetical protein IKW64_01610 [Clostridia bacterium]|nr:hypothetical protein [Clostridia bacterium]